MENDIGTRDTSIRGDERYEDHEYRWFAFLLILVLVSIAGH